MIIALVKKNKINYIFIYNKLIAFFKPENVIK